MSFFDALEQVPDDPLLSLPIFYNQDSRLNKIDLSLGVYQNAHGQVTSLECIYLAEELVDKQKTAKKYPPIDGYEPYSYDALKLILGNRAFHDGVYKTQALGGCGALRLGGALLNKLGISKIYVSDPTWPNHFLIFKYAGLTVETYPYYDQITHSFEFEKFCAFIKKLPSGSVVVLQSSCHNPTGIDPSVEQWKEISKLFLLHHIIPFFDVAYQGLGDGLQEDVEAIRYFYDQGHEMMIAYSFSKNLTLYGERVGLFAAISKNAQVQIKVSSNIKQIIRSMYSVPPIHGAQLAHTVLTTPELKNLWFKELLAMKTRIAELRAKFAEKLEISTDNNFGFLKQQKGLFSFFGLSETDVERLKKEFAIYLPSSGRLNIAGLNEKNLNYVVNSISSLLKD